MSNTPTKRQKTTREVKELPGAINKCPADVLALIASFLTGKDRYCYFPRIRKSFHLACKKPSSHNSSLIFQHSSERLANNLKQSGAKNITSLSLLYFQDDHEADTEARNPFNFGCEEKLEALRIECSGADFEVPSLRPMPKLERLLITTDAIDDDEKGSCAIDIDFDLEYFPCLTDLTLNNLEGYKFGATFEDQLVQLDVSMIQSLTPEYTIGVMPDNGKNLTHLQMWGYRTGPQSELQNVLDALTHKDAFPKLRLVGFSVACVTRENLNKSLQLYDDDIVAEIFEDSGAELSDLQERFANEPLLPTSDTRVKVLVHRVLGV